MCERMEKFGRSVAKSRRSAALANTINKNSLLIYVLPRRRDDNRMADTHSMVQPHTRRLKSALQHAGIRRITAACTPFW